LEKEVIALDDDWFQHEEKLCIAEKAIEQLGEQCRQILHLFYGAGTAMSDIAKKVGLRNENVAKAQKYRCLQKAKENAKALEVKTLENSML
jgi:DNA-directed RNA polymerase specialized sigma subunit